MKIGVELKIDVTKVDKERLFEGKKGKYLSATVFIDLDNKDEFGNNGMITHKKFKDEKSAPILGNANVFWRSDSGTAPAKSIPAEQHESSGRPDDSFDDDIPF